MRRILLVLTLLIALLAMPAAAFAQATPTTPPVACGDLAKADCTFLQDSQDANRAISTFDADVNLDFSLTDVPNLPKDISFSVASTGSYSVNPDLSTQAMGLESKMATDPAGAAADLLDLGLAFYTDTNFDMTWDITLSKDVAALLSQQAGVAVPEKLHLPMRMVDGFFYANVDDFAALMPGAAGWIGFDIAGLMKANLKQSTAALEQGMANMDPAAMGAMLGSSATMNPELQAALNANTKVERLDDATVDGVDAAQFRWTFDLPGFITSPAVVKAVVDQAKAQIAAQTAAGEDPGVTAADLDMVTGMLPMFAPTLLSGINFETNASLGIKDMYVYNTETKVDWDLGSVIGMVGTLMGGGAPTKVAGKPAFALDVAAQNSNIDGDVKIEAPAGAVIIPLDQLMGSSDTAM